MIPILPILLFLLGVPQSASAKLPIHGLTSMGVVSPGKVDEAPPNDLAELYAHPDVYRGVVINVRFSQIEPSEGKYDFSAIDEGLRAVAKYNAKHLAHPVVGKLRIFAGPSTPGWLMKLSGGPIDISTHAGDAQIPGFWTPQYIKVWRALQVALAGKYDADPLMGEVAATSCATMTGEAFIVPQRAEAQKNMRADGYSDAADEACLRGAIDDYAPWKLTPLDYTFSEHLKLDSGHLLNDDVLPLEIMHQWRDRLGGRAILSNHSVQDPIVPILAPTYASLKQMGAPIELQTASQGVIARGKDGHGGIGAARPDGSSLMDWNKVIQNALGTGAGEIEIWPNGEGGGSAKITMAMLQAWAAKLRQ